MSGRRTLGISRNRWNVLAEQRSQHRARQAPSARPLGSRFSKERLVRGVEMELAEAPGLIEGLKKPLVEELSSASTMDSIRPQWMGHYEECQQLLRAVDDLRREMLLYQNKRLTCVKVSEQKSFESKIYQCAREATMRIKRSELVLELLKREEQEESPANARICKSIIFKLANQIQEVTKQLRSQQRSFIEQRKQFEVTEKASFLQVAAEHALTGNFFEDELVQDEAMLELESRNEQIKKIVQSIFELNGIYKELGQLVLLQGSLLDRIDQNINQSQKAIANGAEHLVKAQKHQKRSNRCACGVMIAQLIAISILTIILMVKWSK